MGLLWENVMENMMVFYGEHGSFFNGENVVYNNTNFMGI